MNNDTNIGLKWLYLIIILFVAGLAFLMLNFVMTDYLVPTAQSLINTSVTNSTIATSSLTQIDKWTSFWDFIPWILLFLGIVFVVILALKKETYP